MLSEPRKFSIEFCIRFGFIEYIIYLGEMMRKMGEHRNPCNKIDQCVRMRAEHELWTLHNKSIWMAFIIITVGEFEVEITRIAQWREVFEAQRPIIKYSS